MLSNRNKKYYFIQPDFFLALSNKRDRAGFWKLHSCTIEPGDSCTIEPGASCTIEPDVEVSLTFQKNGDTHILHSQTHKQG